MFGIYKYFNRFRNLVGFRNEMFLNITLNKLQKNN